MNTSFFGEMLQTISERGRALIDRARDRRGDAAARSAESGRAVRGTAVRARRSLGRRARARNFRPLYDELTTGPRIAFFEALATRFGVGPRAASMPRSMPGAREGTDEAAAELHLAAEPRRQELFRRLNLAPGGTAALVAMREELIDAHGAPRRPRAGRPGFRASVLVLVQSRLPGAAPHRLVDARDHPGKDHPLRGGAQIRDWDDLRRRIDPPDRRCYAFFHPALNDEPLIFVEVAFTNGIPGRDRADPRARTRHARARARQHRGVLFDLQLPARACRRVSFGNFLIKQVVEEISREFPRLSTFVTLSPVPGFAGWLARERTSDNPILLAGGPRAR